MRGVSQCVLLYTGAQIKFGDLTSYLIDGWMGEVSHADSAKWGEFYRKIFGDDRRPSTPFQLIPSAILANKNVILTV